jgi:hypothetical protein
MEHQKRGKGDEKWSQVGVRTPPDALALFPEIALAIGEWPNIFDSQILSSALRQLFEGIATSIRRRRIGDRRV